MRVLFVISTLRMGGAERVCASIANEFSKEHNVSVVKFDTQTPFYELNQSIRLISLNQSVSELGFGGNFKKRFAKIFGLRKLMKESKFDAIISFLDSTNLLTLAASFALKQNVIISEHTSFDAPKPKWLNPLKRALYPLSNGLCVLTKRDFMYYKNFVKNVSVLHNPFFGDIPKNREFKKENLVIFVGRLTRLKNCEMFIKIASNLKHSGFKFRVIGDGDELERLKNLSVKLGLNVEFMGALKDVSSQYESAKVLLNTSVYEGLGNTLIEAACFECARVASKTSGACELITHDKDGVLVDINDDLAMSEAVLELMRDEKKRQELCQNARAKADEFAAANIYQKWLNIVQSGVK